MPEAARLERRRRDLASYHRRSHRVAAQKRHKAYGLAPDDYNTMLEAQGGVCAICGAACVSGKRLAVDHRHADGVIRGLTCTRCNLGLGNFVDNPWLLRAAAAYLERAPATMPTTCS